MFASFCLFSASVELGCACARVLSSTQVTFSESECVSLPALVKPIEFNYECILSRILLLHSMAFYFISERFCHVLYGIKGQCRTYLDQNPHFSNSKQNK